MGRYIFVPKLIYKLNSDKKSERFFIVVELDKNLQGIALDVGEPKLFRNNDNFGKCILSNFNHHYKSTMMLWTNI